MIARCAHPALAILAVGMLVGCQPAERDGMEDAEGSASEDNVVQVTARDFAFEAPQEVPSGWTTLRMENAGEQHHFLVLWRLPDGKTFQDYIDEVIPPFDTLVEAYDAGELDRDELMAGLGAALPEWFASVEGMGGPGLTAPGMTSETTVHLEPGSYVMECYVRTPDGRFHGALGMFRPITVTDASSGTAEPEADLEMTLSNYEIATTGELTPGRHSVRVDVAEMPEGLLGHDVHVARLDEGTSLDQVAGWMDWIDAFRDPPPATFIGGAEQVPPGHTSYFTVDLEPGRYAWVSEGYAAMGMVQEFTVE